jgi:hypothetical protein
MMAFDDIAGVNRSLKANAFLAPTNNHVILSDVLDLGLYDS